MPKPERMPVQFHNIPDALKTQARWVMWNWTKSRREDKWTKPPVQINGNLASVDNPATWSDYEDVVEAYLSGQFDGVGIVLPEDVVGVDVDDCIADGEWTGRAYLVTALEPGRTYTEISPSGTGIKMLGLGQVNPKLKRKARGIELYDRRSRRYFTITGNVPKGFPIRINKIDEALAGIQSLINPAKEEKSLGDDFKPKQNVLKEAIACLEHLREERADDYSQWLQVGMALHWVDGSDEMLDRWYEWSKLNERKHLEMGDEEWKKKWNSFHEDSNRALVTLRTLKKWAMEDGYDPDKYQTLAVTAADLCRKEIIRDYIVDDFLIRNEPMVVGGASKSLKTTVMMDLAVSIASGTKFLGKFSVENPQKVMFLSGESGEATLQEYCKLIAHRKELDTNSLDLLQIGYKLPKLDDDRRVDNLIEDLQKRDTDIVIIDPLYRCFRVGDYSSNVFAMGEKLEGIAESLYVAGITTILVHHFRKQGKTYHEPPELEDLSQAGLAEFCRQSMLIKRREAYQYNGKHSLWFFWGGSAGHQGMSVLKADTGTRAKGLAWDPRMVSVTDYKEEKKEERQLDTEILVQAEEERLPIAIVEAIKCSEKGLNKTQLLREVKPRQDCREKFYEIRDQLETDGVISREEKTYRVVESVPADD